MKSTNQHFHFFWPAVGILLLASIFRLVSLSDIPPGLAQDEVLNADVASFIQQGQHALFFREGFGHEPLYHYWTVPFQFLLGDNVLSIRLPAVYLGLLLVAATLRWVRRDFDAPTAVVTGLGLAVSWWPIIFSRVGLRPIMEPLFLVGAAWFWSRRPGLAGLLLGLTVYTYTAARLVLLIPLLFGGYLLISQRPHRSIFNTLRSPALLLGIALTVYLPLGLTLRADPSLQQRLEQLEGPLVALRNGDVRPVLQATLSTLGVFAWSGDPRWTYSVPNRPLFDPLTASFFFGGLILALVRWRQPRYGLLLIWLAVTLLPSALTPQAPSTVRLIGALPVVYLLPGIAIQWLCRQIQRHSTLSGGHSYWLAGFGLLMALVVTFNLTRTINDGFIQWPDAIETRLKYQSVLMDIGRHWRQIRASAPVISTGFFEPITADSLKRDLGYDPQARWVQAGPDVAGALILPFDQVDRGLYVPEYAPVSADLLSSFGIGPHPQFRSLIKPSYAYYSLPSQLDIPHITPTVTFDQVITLLGYQITPQVSGQPMRLLSYWRVNGALPWDLAVFVQLLTGETNVVTQHDGLDAAPTSLRPGDIFVQRHILPWPVDSEEGPYTLQLGLYTRGSGRRLLHPGQPSDRLVLSDNWFLTEHQ